MAIRHGAERLVENWPVSYHSRWKTRDGRTKEKENKTDMDAQQLADFKRRAAEPNRFEQGKTEITNIVIGKPHMVRTMDVYF